MSKFAFRFTLFLFIILYLPPSVLAQEVSQETPKEAHIFVELTPEEIQNLSSGYRHVFNNKISFIMGAINMALEDQPQEALPQEMGTLALQQIKEFMKILGLKNHFAASENSAVFIESLQMALEKIITIQQSASQVINLDPEFQERLQNSIKNIRNVLEISLKIFDLSDARMQMPSLEDFKKNIDTTVGFAKEPALFNDVVIGEFKAEDILNLGDILNDYFNENSDNQERKRPEINFDMSRRRLTLELKYNARALDGSMVFPWMVLKRGGGGFSVLLTKIFLERRCGATFTPFTNAADQFEGFTVSIPFHRKGSPDRGSFVEALERSEVRLAKIPDDVRAVEDATFSSWAERILKEYPEREVVLPGEFGNFFREQLPAEFKKAIDTERLSDRLAREILRSDFSWSRENILRVVRECGRVR